MTQTAEDQLVRLNAALAAIVPAWTVFSSLLKERADSLTLELIGDDNEQTRGRIKELRHLLNLPELLQQERDGIRAGLDDESPAISLDGTSE